MYVEKNSDDQVSIVLGEHFDFKSVGAFRENYESIEGVDGAEVIIDFRHTRFVDSSALGMLINANAFFAAMGCRLKFVNANAQIKQIFSISRFDKKFEIT